MAPPPPEIGRPSGPGTRHSGQAAGSRESIVIPESLVASRGRSDPVWLADLPNLVAAFLDRWRLRLDGPPRSGMASLVLPVSRSDGTPAVLKLQPVDDENVGESLGLRVWAGRGAVLLLDEDPDAGVLLLERLDPDRSLASLPIDDALAILVGLLARLVAEPAPAGLRRLADVAAAMVEDTPSAVGRLADLADRRLISRCAAMVREVLPEPGDRLLHWDLHYENVLAGTREPWLAIDPKPLAGDPGFDLLPALWNRWDDVVATADVPRAVLRRFDLMVEVLGLERQRAVAWSLARVLQNALWDVADGETTVDGPQRTIAEALTSR